MVTGGIGGNKSKDTRKLSYWRKHQRFCFPFWLVDSWNHQVFLCWRVCVCVCVLICVCVFVCMWVHACWIAEVALHCSLGAVYLVFWEEVSSLKLCLCLAPQHEDCKCVPLSLAFLWVPELGLRSLPCKASTLLTELSLWTSFYLCIPSGSSVSGESQHSDLFNEWLWYCQLFTWIWLLHT